MPLPLEMANIILSKPFGVTLFHGESPPDFVFPTIFCDPSRASGVCLVSFTPLALLPLASISVQNRSFCLSLSLSPQQAELHQLSENYANSIRKAFIVLLSGPAI